MSGRKTWDFHVKTALNTSLDENLEMIRQSLIAAKAGASRCLIANISLMGTKITRFCADCIRLPPKVSNLGGVVRYQWGHIADEV